VLLKVFFDCFVSSKEKEKSISILYVFRYKSGPYENEKKYKCTDIRRETLRRAHGWRCGNFCLVPFAPLLPLLNIRLASGGHFLTVSIDGFGESVAHIEC